MACELLDLLPCGQFDLCVFSLVRKCVVCREIIQTDMILKDSSFLFKLKLT